MIFLIGFDTEKDGPNLNEAAQILNKRFKGEAVMYDIVDQKRFSKWLALEIHTQRLEREKESDK